MRTNKVFFAAMIAVCAFTMTTLIGCNGKNEPTPTPEPDTKPVAAAIQFEAVFDPLTIEQCDISFDYYDENGNKKNEVVTTTEWTKNIKSAALPATLGFHWNLAVKAGLDESKYDQFLVKYQFTYASCAVNAEGAAVTTKEQADFGNIMSMAIAKRDYLVESILSHNPINFLHKYDAEGKFTQEDWK